MRAAKNSIRKPIRRKAPNKPRNRYRPNFRFLGWTFLVSAAMSMVASCALQTDGLRVKHFAVNGVRFADAKVVRAAAKTLGGKNILIVRKSLVTRKLRNVAEIESATVHRDLPDSIRVEVTERSPLCVLARNGDYCVMDRGKYLFHKTHGPVRGLPTIHVPGDRPIREGCAATSDDISECVRALELATRKGMPVIKVSIDLDGDMCLNMVGGLVVKLGQPEDIARKMAILKTALVLRPSISREAAYIDVSCPRFPVWKPKSLSRVAS
jgi:cell division protein FtsQ